MSRYLVNQIEREPRITQLVGLAGPVFAFIDAQRKTDWLDGYVDTDLAGFVLTGADTAKSGVPFLSTTRPGVFAAGDVRSGSTKRVAAAVGEGSQAVTFVRQDLAATFAAR